MSTIRGISTKDPTEGVVGGVGGGSWASVLTCCVPPPSAGCSRGTDEKPPTEGSSQDSKRSGRSPPEGSGGKDVAGGGDVRGSPAPSCFVWSSGVVSSLTGDCNNMSDNYYDYHGTCSSFMQFKVTTTNKYLMITLMKSYQ